MATDGPTPKPCDPDIHAHGAVVAYYETFGANAFEKLVQQVASASQCPVDWHYVGGRAVVKCLPKDVAKVRAFCERMIEPVIAGKRQEYLNDIHTPRN